MTAREPAVAPSAIPPAAGEPTDDAPSDSGSPPPSPQPTAARDPIERILGFPTVRRLFRLALFVGLILLFRKLLVLLVFFVAFERSLGRLARLVAERTRIPRKAALALVSLGLLAVLGVV